ncbi:hypothetical protein [Natronospora cellulosivora (SeqCode)]
MLIFKYKEALKNDKKLKEIYIEENDERSKMIKEKSNTLTLEIIHYILAFALVISLAINKTVLYTLFAFVLLLLIKEWLTKLYYESKY